MRFFEVGNVGRLEKKLDQIYIGNLKLYVNVLRHRRSKLKQYRDTRRIGRITGREIPRETKKHSMVILEVKKKMKGKEVWMEKNGNKSYADAVRGSTQNNWKGSIITSTHLVLPWMKSSVVGQFSIELDFEQLCKEFVKGGMNLIKVRYMWDNLALLTPRELECMEDLIKLNKECFESVFETIDP